MLRRWDWSPGLPESGTCSLATRLCCHEEGPTLHWSLDKGYIGELRSGHTRCLTKMKLTSQHGRGTASPLLLPECSPTRPGCGPPGPVSEPQLGGRQAFGALVATTGPTPGRERWQQRRQAYRWQHLSRENHVPEAGQDPDNCPQGPSWASVSDSRRKFHASMKGPVRMREKLGNLARAVLNMTSL